MEVVSPFEFLGSERRVFLGLLVVGFKRTAAPAPEDCGGKRSIAVLSVICIVAFRAVFDCSDNKFFLNVVFRVKCVLAVTECGSCLYILSRDFE